MEKEKIVVTGVNGFVGRHLARELNNCGLNVVGVGLESEVSPNISDEVKEYCQVDLTKKWPGITEVRAVIHLASLANVGESFNKPQEYISVNSSMVTNMCEYYLERNDRPRILIVSSGNVYDSNQPMPISEDGKIGYASPYAISKVLNESQAAYYRGRGLDCVIARPFNHIGPGQEKGFIVPDFYDRIASLENDEKTIITGNIETRRDYTDVRDIAKAYGKIALANTLRYCVYNVCSGTSCSGMEILNELKRAMGRPDIEYQIDQSLVRPTDIKDITGNASRLNEELGWEPQIDIAQTINDFVKSKSSS